VLWLCSESSRCALVVLCGLPEDSGESAAHDVGSACSPSTFPCCWRDSGVKWQEFDLLCPMSDFGDTAEGLGSNPLSSTTRQETGNGQDKPAAGHFMSEGGQPQGNLETAHATGCTNLDNSPPSCGHFQSTIRAQSEHNQSTIRAQSGHNQGTIRAQFEHNEHNQSTTDRELPVDLPLVVEAWEDLPDVVRAAIVGMG